MGEHRRAARLQNGSPRLGLSPLTAMKRPHPAPLKTASTPPRTRAAHVFLLAALWWLLNPQDATSWIVGVPAVVLAAWAETRLMSDAHQGIRLRALPRFIPYFLFTSIHGGFDVARRALHPQRPIRPTLLHLPLRLPDGTARVFMINVVSLLPGTLSADLEESVLVVHALSHPDHSARGIRTLEAHVARLFDVPLSAGGSVS